MSDLVAFLRARLADDEAAAKLNGGWWTVTETGTGTYEGRQDAKRTLREVEAKRKILALHHLHDEDSLTQYSPRLCSTCCEPGAYENPQEYWPCPTILAVAAIWSDHADYDPAWRVT